LKGTPLKRTTPKRGDTLPRGATCCSAGARAGSIAFFAGFTIWIHHLFEALFDRLAACWKDLSDENVFSIDSFPVPVCDNIRINDCRINDCRINDCRIYPSDATEDAFRDYIASKRRFFYGLKVHVMTDAEGRPVEASLKPGSLGDTGQLRGFEFDLPEEAIAHGDKAYGRVFHRRHAG
jgi:hypothetical protein